MCWQLMLLGWRFDGHLCNCVVMDPTQVHGCQKWYWGRHLAARLSEGQGQNYSVCVLCLLKHCVHNSLFCLYSVSSPEMLFLCSLLRSLETFSWFFLVSIDYVFSPLCSLPSLRLDLPTLWFVLLLFFISFPMNKIVNFLKGESICLRDLRNSKALCSEPYTLSMFKKS